MPVGIWYPARGTESGITDPDLFPNLPGLVWTVKKVPIWKTEIQESHGGLETRVEAWSYPRWRWTLEYEVLRSDTLSQELQALAGYFLYHRGASRSFLLEDRADNYAEGVLLGTGDGATRAFQLVRSMQNMYYEPITEVNGDPTIYLDGEEVASGWSVGAGGILTFGTAPADEVEITADFYFFFRVRFADDEAELENFMWNLWNAKKVDLISVKGEWS